MRGFHRFRGLGIGALIGAFGLLGAGLAPAAVPSDERGFTADVRDRFVRELPAFHFVAEGELTIRASRPDGASAGDFSLDRIFVFCRENPAEAERVVQSYVHRACELIRQENAPADPGRIRLVIRRLDYIRGAIARMGPGPRAAFYQAIGDELAVVPVLDFPTSVRYVGDKDCDQLKIAEADAFRLGEENLRKTERPFADVAKVPRRGQLGIIEEEYAPSRLVFAADWAALAAKLHGPLIAMVPTSDRLIYVEGSSREAVEALRTFGLEAARRSERPLSPLLLRWTKDGWRKFDE